MSEYIRLINTADRIARLWIEGQTLAIDALEGLVALGFYSIEFHHIPRSVSAEYNGIRWPLGQGAST